MKTTCSLIGSLHHTLSLGQCLGLYIHIKISYYNNIIIIVIICIIRYNIDLQHVEIIDTGFMSHMNIFVSFHSMGKREPIRSLFMRAFLIPCALNP